MKKTITDYNYNGKKVIIRCDLNVPIENGIITDDTRIKESLKSIKYLIDNNAKTIILSHLGKIKTQEDKSENTLYPVYIKLREYLNTNVYFSRETRGESLEELVNNLKEKDVLLVENTRFEDFPDKLESNCDEKLSKYWASLGDIFINDAYGTCHRAHASNVGIAKNLMNKYRDKIILPVDIVTNNKNIREISSISDNEIGFDIGPQTIELFTDILKKSKRVIINGPMGVFEEEGFSNGTKKIYEIIKEKHIKTLIGGGDSAASVNKLGFANDFFHISTGGGATLEYLSGTILPGIAVIEEK